MKLLFVALFLSSIYSLGEIVVSKEIDMNLSLLQKIEEKVKKAEKRPGPLMKHQTAYLVTDELLVWCPSSLPTNNGLGCKIPFEFKILEGGSFTVIKDLNIYGFTEKANLELEKHDPTISEKHIHLGSIFSKETTKGSHFYCIPNKKDAAWNCKLYIREVLTYPKTSGL